MVETTVYVLRYVSLFQNTYIISYDMLYDMKLYNVISVLKYDVISFDGTVYDIIWCHII